ncbi:MAG: methylated-DNA--[protein]-cysteine S-methyltransferase, partial [Myxococcales bacterium]
GRLALRGVYFADAPHARGRLEGAREDARLFAPFVAEQLRPWLAGDRTTFDVALAPQGTPFQREVWSALRAIPYGTTTTYGALALAIGRPAAVRAVGLANGKNPLSILVPCHRVIGRDGSLTGYAGGLPAKEALLALEARVARA